MQNDIAELRSHLFNTLSALQDKQNPMDIERAKAVCQVGDVIISSAKAEIDFARVNGSVDTQFFNKPAYVPQLENKPATKPIKPIETEVKDPFERPQAEWETKNGHVTVENGITTHKMK